MELAEVKGDNKFLKLLKWVLSAFDNHSSGSSGKKWTAFALVICVIFSHVSWLINAHAHNDYSLLTTVLVTDFAFISTLFGINVADKKLNGNTVVTTIEGKTPGASIMETEIQKT